MTDIDRLDFYWAMCHCHVWPLAYGGGGSCGECEVVPYERCDEPVDGKACVRGRW